MSHMLYKYKNNERDILSIDDKRQYYTISNKSFDSIGFDVRQYSVVSVYNFWLSMSWDIM